MMLRPPVHLGPLPALCMRTALSYSDGGGHGMVGAAVL